ncbi:MAG: pyridoxamine 5'-phosphate oxidase family protein [Fuerstiella sp.]
MTTQNFHQGELRLQEHCGMRETIGKMAERMIHDFIPERQREFFGALEYVFLGTVDQRDLPHTSLVTGPVGFIQTPVPEKMVIQTGSRTHRPEFEALDVGQSVGVLGIDLSCRRRNRVHGRVTAIDDHTITIKVVQFYGNCPKYISLREIAQRQVGRPRQNVVSSSSLSPADIHMISTSDTFFIASYVRDDSEEPYEGVDVSHRGGQPGFVSVDSNSQITIPDYAGNNLFNTLGNLLMNPAAGLLFIDFETGDELHIHGQATLIEDSVEQANYPGAQRLLRIQIQKASRQAAVTALRWKFIQFSPVNPVPEHNDKTL